MHVKCHQVWRAHLGWIKSWTDTYWLIFGLGRSARHPDDRKLCHWAKEIKRDDLLLMKVWTSWLWLHRQLLSTYPNRFVGRFWILPAFPTPRELVDSSASHGSSSEEQVWGSTSRFLLFILCLFWGEHVQFNGFDTHWFKPKWTYWIRVPGMTQLCWLIKWLQGVLWCRLYSGSSLCTFFWHYLWRCCFFLSLTWFERVGSGAL